MLFGGWFSNRPEPLEVREVAVISGAEFDALTEAARQPQEIAETPTPAAPEVTQDAPEVDVAPEEPAPAPPPPPEDPAPAPVEEPAPEVSDAAPVLPQPPAEVTVQDAPVDDTPVERPNDVVRPDPAPAPEPEVAEAPEPQEAAVPEETGETVEEPQEAAQTPEASDRIVTEAPAPPAAAPTASMRPPARRPSAPAPRTAGNIETSAPQEDTVDDAAVQAALEAALSSAAEDIPTGPPMTSGEKDDLRLAVQNCWNVDTGAQWPVVTVAMSMTQDGKVVQTSLRMIGSDGGDPSRTDAAFGAARRAILLCQRGGFPLPPEKYGQWKEIEMTFDPNRMRIQ
ncbi:energy transducer TonB [Sulfitobacter albidus]|uniref:Energy transducer TonB n=1 Tax=Sulfitobacter albidus TaxID=2829501 RepID=A0A975JGY6_9RHOB|nr:energy transducer TonB [Sulfitobacter albidus]